VSRTLELTDFTVLLEGEGAPVALAEGIDLHVAEGETLCIVGESGSGKSVTMLSVARLLELTAPVRLEGGARVGDLDVLTLDQDQMAAVRAGEIGFVFQEAMEALNPTQTIGTQLVRAHRLIKGVDGGRRSAAKAALTRATELLLEVGLDRPEVVLASFPHQLSGGMQQRVVIALALIGEPRILIADEPTTALDVTIQEEILHLLKRIQRSRGMSCVLITHDMGVAATVADRIAVMYAGQVVEVGPTHQMLTAPQHPYTKALLECVPRAGQRVTRLRSIPGSVPAPGSIASGDRFARRNRMASDHSFHEDPPVHVSADGTHMVRSWDPVLTWTDAMVADLTGDPDAPEAIRRPPIDEVIAKLRGVNKTYLPGRARQPRRIDERAAARGTRAVVDLDLDIRRGELFGIVGETGSGKSTLGRLLLDLEHADFRSQLTVAGVNLAVRRTFAQERELRRRVQMIFQNPQHTLDPRLTVGRAIAEPLRSLTKLGRTEIAARVREMLDAVGLPATTVDKYPSEISGGQRQRVAIARAIAPKPELIVADEPTSALDVSVQGQIVNLMLDLQQEFSLTYVFITHNLSLITSIADRVGVMYKGRLVEVADATAIVENPQHEYTRRLIASNPAPLAVG
jgi:oligopeptide/dipeptide ABC transporter ATP-binding protein